MSIDQRATAFLTARYDEQEATVNAVSPHGPDGDHLDWAEYSALERRWNQQLHGRKCGWKLGEQLALRCSCGAGARILADLVSKRALLELHTNENDGECATCAHASGWFGRTGTLLPDPYPCETLRHLLAPFADHPDFDPDWALPVAPARTRQ